MPKFNIITWNSVLVTFNNLYCLCNDLLYFCSDTDFLSLASSSKKSHPSTLRQGWLECGLLGCPRNKMLTVEIHILSKSNPIVLCSPYFNHPCLSLTCFVVTWFWSVWFGSEFLFRNLFIFKMFFICLFNACYNTVDNFYDSMLHDMLILW